MKKDVRDRMMIKHEIDKLTKEEKQRQKNKFQEKLLEA